MNDSLIMCENLRVCESVIFKTASIPFWYLVTFLNRIFYKINSYEPSGQHLEYCSNCQIFVSMYYFLLGQKQKILYFRESQNKFQCFFWRHSLGQIVSSFEVVLLGSSPTNGWRVKGTLSIKISVLWFLELEFCDSRTPIFFSKT